VFNAAAYFIDRHLEEGRAATIAIFCAPFVVGVVGSRLTLPSLRGWYRTLDRPA